MPGTNDPKKTFSPVVFSGGITTRPATPLKSDPITRQPPVTSSLKDNLNISPKLSIGNADELKKLQPLTSGTHQVQPSTQNSNNHDNARQTFLTTLHSIVTKLFNSQDQEAVVKAYKDLMDLLLYDERFAVVFPKLTMMFFKEHEAFIQLLQDEQKLDFSHLVTGMLESGAISNHLNKMSLTSIINLILIMLDTQGTTTENQNKIDAIVDDFLTKWEQTPTQSSLFGTEQILFLLSHISDEQDKDNKLRVMELMQLIANNPQFSVENETLFNQLIDILLTTKWIEPKLKPHAEPEPRPSSANISASRSTSGGSGSGGSK